jgi:hypothetical protein
MAINWQFADSVIDLRGVESARPDKIDPADGLRQQETARSILDDLRLKPGVILADEVGMGKTYVALAVVASVLLSTRDDAHPVVVMVPSGLSSKWQKEWEQFKSLCCRNADALNRMRSAYVGTPTEFLKLLDDQCRKRVRLIWMTTSCFHAGLYDGWIKLAFVRLARSNSRLSDETKRRIYKWATEMSRLKSRRHLTPGIVESLMNLKVSQWHRYLISEGILDEGSNDPIPAQLLQHQHHLNWSNLARFLREDVPGRQGDISNETLRQKRQEFNNLCGMIYWEWLQKVNWRASLLVLDEAHHAKNDETRLAKLFRSEGLEDLLCANDNLPGNKRPRLWDKFDRMLFLTATPFQLGHHELMRVIRSFAAAKWSGPLAPEQTRQQFIVKLKVLEQRLSENRRAGKRLDAWWGRIDRTTLGNYLDQNTSLSDAAFLWWRSVEQPTTVSLIEEIKKAVVRCRETKLKAEDCQEDPWTSLRAWVIRHNRPTLLPSRQNEPPAPRREYCAGNAIADVTDTKARGIRGISLGPDEAAPFFIAARAQGEMAQFTGKGRRAFFAEGLCSSYEAFHHTREQRGDVRDVDDYGIEHRSIRRQSNRSESIVPVKWYEQHVSLLIPSKNDKPIRCFGHPKIKPVVRRAVDLWLSGEKVLVFCFYRQTAIALRDHIRREVEYASARRAAIRLGLDPTAISDVRNRLALITNRLGDKESPFYREVIEYLERQIDHPEFTSLSSDIKLRQRLIDLLASYVRSAAYVSRFLPLDVPDIRKALVDGKPGAIVVRKGVMALRETLESSSDLSGMSLRQRTAEFLRFVWDLASKDRRREVNGHNDGSAESQLNEYLEAVSVYISPRGSADDETDEERAGSYRAMPVVRMVYGDTVPLVRQRMMFAFNSPLFPEILISSAVLGEGVDLHRFCRYVIHHDLCWNPSTLEQRTGRLDRIRCKAELVRHPIVIYEPFIAGSADEKMYRVVKDRERWFQIVMGQKFEFDEKSAEDIARRIPLPEALAQSLVFDLRRYRGPSSAGS